MGGGAITIEPRHPMAQIIRKVYIRILDSRSVFCCYRISESKHRKITGLA